MDDGRIVASIDVYNGGEETLFRPVRLVTSSLALLMKNGKD